MLKQKKFIPYVLLTILFVTYILLEARFFEYFPNGWDQTESAWAIKDNYLPHSPYILYFFLGKAINLIIPNPAIALTFISSFFGFLSLILFYYIQDNFKPFKNINRIARAGISLYSLLSVVFISVNYLFIRQSSTQEPYTVQLFFIFLSIWLIQNPSRIRVLFSGIVFGCAIAIHYGSLFALPALLFLMTSINKRVYRRYTLLFWCTSVLLIILLLLTIIYLLLPVVPGRDPIVNTLIYARGLGPGISIHNIYNPSFLVQSFTDLLQRLLSLDILQIRRPPPSFPIGITWLNALVAMIGGIFLWRRNRKITVFWLLYCLPYLIYEVIAGQTPDFGAYLVFFLPLLAVFEASAVVSLMEFSFPNHRRKFWRITSAGILMVVLMLPSIVLFNKYWGDVEKDVLKHYSYWVLAEISAATTLPANAIVIQPIEEWNVNHLPYYTTRRHIARNGDLLYTFNDWGPFTPLNPSSFELLTTEKLSNLISSDVPVYSFESNPLTNTRSKILNPDCFEWYPDHPIDISQVKDQLLIPENLRKRLPSRTGYVYLGQIKLCD